MKPERLQFIKDKWIIMATGEVILELITAVEQAQAELAEAHSLSDKLGISCAKFLKENNDYRVQLDGKDRLEAQLAEAQSELAECKHVLNLAQGDNFSVILCERNRYFSECAALRKQLAEALAEVERLTLSDYRKEQIANEIIS